MAETVRKTVWRAWLKWVRVVKGEIADRGDLNCPLCHRYYFKHVAPYECSRFCPIVRQTGEGGCGGTPFNDFSRITPIRAGEGRWAKTDEQKKAARKMRDWLARLYKKLYGVHPSKESWAKESKK